MVDQTLIRKNARIMRSADDDKRRIKRFRNTVGESVSAEVGGSVVSQEPLFICMGYNCEGASASYDCHGRPLNNVKSCYVSSSLNHLQASTEQRRRALETRYIKYEVARDSHLFATYPNFNRQLDDGEELNQLDGNVPFMPTAGRSRPVARFLETLALYHTLKPTFVGFASGTYEAPPSIEIVKKPPHLAANCGGLMTVQATNFDHGKWAKAGVKGGISHDRSSIWKDPLNYECNQKGIEVGEMMCIDLPPDNWQNHQCGVDSNKMTLVVCNGRKAQKEHRRNFDRANQAAPMRDKIKRIRVPIGIAKYEHMPMALLHDETTIADDKRRCNFLHDSYMTRPLCIGQCRSGCQMGGQMADLKFDVGPMNISDLINFAVGVGA